MRKGIKKVPFSHIIATFFVFSLVSGEVESSLVGKSGREIWISVFAMMISCPELVKIKRVNKIKEVRSGVVGTASMRNGVRSGANGMDSGRVGARSSTIITARGTVGASSGMMGTAGGTMGMRSGRYAVRSGRYVARSGMVGMAGVRDDVRSGVAVRAAVG